MLSYVLIKTVTKAMLLQLQPQRWNKEPEIWILVSCCSVAYLPKLVVRESLMELLCTIDRKNKIQYSLACFKCKLLQLYNSINTMPREKLALPYFAAVKELWHKHFITWYSSVISHIMDQCTVNDLDTCHSIKRR